MIDTRAACETFAGRLLDDQLKGGTWLRALEYDNPQVRSVVRRWRRPDGYVPYAGLMAVAALYISRSVEKMDSAAAAQPSREIVPKLRRGPRNFLKIVEHG